MSTETGEQQGATAEASEAPRQRLALKMVTLEMPKSAQEVDLLPEFEGAEGSSSLLPAPRWKEPGEQFVGTYLGYREITLNEKARRLYLFDQARTGTRVGVWNTTVLDTELASVAPRAGDNVCIVFMGDRATARGQNPAHVFRVYVIRVNGAAGA
jgi:hypothetical protein